MLNTCLLSVESFVNFGVKCGIGLLRWESPNYYLTEEKIILGELEKSVCINTVILLTKKVIYNAMKENKKPHLLAIKNETKNFYFQEKYRLYIKGKRQFFERRYALLYNTYEEI